MIIEPSSVTTISIRFTMKRILRAITPQSFLRTQETSLETPPVQTTGGCPAEREYIPEGWSYAESHQVVRGCEVDDICDIYGQKWPKFYKCWSVRGHWDSITSWKT